MVDLRWPSAFRPFFEDLEERLPEYRAVETPTLLVSGEQDRALLTGNLDGLKDYVADLTIERIPEGSHWVNNSRAGYLPVRMAARVGEQTAHAA